MDKERLSFRDPAGQLVQNSQGIFRVVLPEHTAHVRSLIQKPTLLQWMEEGRLIGTRTLSSPEKVLRSSDDSLWLEHDRVTFASFPYEWCPEMLLAAAELTLDFNEKLIKEGLGLKDATPDNILFEGAQPIFVDLLSIERRNPNEASWTPFAQFLRTFVTPLMASRYLGLTMNMIFLTHRDGLTPEEVYEMCGPWRRFLPPFFALVTVPKWLSDRNRKTTPSGPTQYQVSTPDKAAYIFRALNNHLRELLKKVLPKSKSSAWTRYLQSPIEYTEAQFSKKEYFLRSFLDRYEPKHCLDVGCNTGYFSQIAAEHGAKVVAIDADEASVSRLFLKAKKNKLAILPLVMNLARPSPATGWKNEENPSFLERAEHKFDAVFFFAVVHHLLWTERVPLAEVVELSARLTKRFVVMEYVDPSDPSFARMMRGRQKSLPPLTPDIFENAFGYHFDLLDSLTLTEHRKLYLFEKVTGA